MRPTAILFIASATVLAQQPGPDTAKRNFEVASIKPNTSGGSTSTENTAPGRLTATNVTVGELIQVRIRHQRLLQLSGASWLAPRQPLPNVVATTQTAVELTDTMLEPYLLSLLVDRCQFRYHRETKELQAYSLAVAKNGPRLAVHAGETIPSTHEISHGPGKTFISATNATMANLANLLNRRLKPNGSRQHWTEGRLRHQARMGAQPDRRKHGPVAVHRITGTTRAETRIDKRPGRIHRGSTV